MRKFAYILLISLYAIPGYSQKSYTLNDSVQITALINKAQEYTDAADYSNAKTLCRQTLALSRKKGFRRGEGNIHTKLADIAYQEGDYEAMDQHDSLAISIALQLKDTVMLALGYEIKGLLLMDSDDKVQAAKFFRDALDIKYEKEQSSDAARVYVNLGVLNANDKTAATNWYLKGIRLYEKNKDEFGLAQAFSNYATHLVSLDRPAEALEYLKKAIVLREKIKDDYGLMYSYANISQVYTTIDSLKQAIFYQKLSVKKAEDIGVSKLKAQSYVGMSLLYSKQKNYKEAFNYEYKAVKLLEQSGNTEMLSRRYIALAMGYNTLGDSASAAAYFNKAIGLASKHNYKENLRDAYQQATIFYKERKDYFNAYENIKKYIQVRDELVGEETVEQIAELETKYETQKKEERIKQLNNEKLIQQLQIERQGLFRNVLIAGIILALCIAYILFNRYQLKKKLEQKTVMLKERSRISAELHDEVGSTLSTINILSHSARIKLKDDVDKSDDLLGKINENSQRMMDAMSDIVWSINPENDELRNISVRMKEFASEILENKSIDYSFHISEELMNMKISPEIRKDMYLVFKEAVNNLAKYSKATTAKISLARINGRLDMLIEDDGNGFDTKLFNSGNGMNNMKKRAEGHGGYFKIESAQGKGTSINLSIPIA